MKKLTFENKDQLFDFLETFDIEDDFDYVKINKNVVIDLATKFFTEKYYPCEDCHYEPAPNHNYPEACISCSRFYGDMYTK